MKNDKIDIEEENEDELNYDFGLVLYKVSEDEDITRYRIMDVVLTNYTDDGYAEIINGEDFGTLREVLFSSDIKSMDLCVMPLVYDFLDYIIADNDISFDSTCYGIVSQLCDILVGHEVEFVFDRKKSINNEKHYDMSLIYVENRVIPDKSLLESIEDIDKEVTSGIRTVADLDNYIKGIDRKEFQKELKEVIIAQDEVVDTISSLVLYNQNIFADAESISTEVYDKEHAIIAGKTGTGKTEIIRQIASRLNIPYVIEHATAFTEEGYVGRSVSEIPADLLRAANGNLSLAERGIVVLDEIDKKSGNFSDKGVSTTGVQNALLPLLDSKDKIKITFNENMGKQDIDFDTSKLTVILMGAFTDIKDEVEKSIGFNKEPQKMKKATYTVDDFIRAGMEPEFMGRITTCIKTNDLSEEDLANILKNSKISPLVAKINSYEKRGISLTYTDDFIESVAKEAYKSGSGARGLKKAFTAMSNELRNAFLDGNVSEIKLEKGRVRKIGIKEDKKYEEEG